MTDIPDVAVDAIAAQIAEENPDLASDKVRPLVVSVLDKVEAATAVAGGDPVDTVRMSTEGVIAKRVMRGGIPVWQITDDGDVHYDAAPTLDWPVIHTPAAS